MALPLEPYNRAAKPVRILVTGGTGFIGGAVLASLFPSDNWPKALIMVRAANLEEGRRRIEASIKRFLPFADVQARLKDSQIILCGLEDAERLAMDTRTLMVTHVVHSAAVTSFANHPRINEINVDASLNFVKTLAECASVERFINVGTAWCIGMECPKLVPENGEQGCDTHVVPYTRSKREFERRVRDEFPEFPLVSARPSIVVGHTELGTGPSGSIYWVFRSAQILGRFTCSYDEKMDVVPVDWVAGALLKLAFKDELWFDTYHLSAGEASYTTIGKLDAAIARGRKGEPHGRHRYERLTSKGLAKAVYENRGEIGDANPLLLGKALGIYSRFADSGVLFDNRRLLAEGIAPSPSFHSYAHVCAATSEATSLAAQMEDDFK